MTFDDACAPSSGSVQLGMLLCICYVLCVGVCCCISLHCCFMLMCCCTSMLTVVVACCIAVVCVVVFPYYVALVVACCTAWCCVFPCMVLCISLHVCCRLLLWHGSRLSNWVGILSQGLRVAPHLLWHVALVCVFPCVCVLQTVVVAWVQTLQLGGYPESGFTCCTARSSSHRLHGEC